MFPCFILAYDEVLETNLLKPSEVDMKTFVEYGLIGSGSGFCKEEHHKSLLDFVNSFPVQIKKKAFVF